MYLQFVQGTQLNVLVHIKIIIYYNKTHIDQYNYESLHSFAPDKKPIGDPNSWIRACLWSGLMFFCSVLGDTINNGPSILIHSSSKHIDQIG